MYGAHLAAPPCPPQARHAPARVLLRSRLELLRVEKPGALGICLEQLSGRVASVDVHAHELLLGVTVAGELYRHPARSTAHASRLDGCFRHAADRAVAPRRVLRCAGVAAQ